MVKVLARGDLKTASSEGCYSHVIASTAGIKVKIAVRSFTDASDEVDDYRIGTKDPDTTSMDDFHEGKGRKKVGRKEGKLDRQKDGAPSFHFGFSVPTLGFVCLLANQQSCFGMDACFVVQPRISPLILVPW